MAFTYDRVDYTAAELNTVWETSVSKIASILPPDVRILSNGLKFDDLVVVEGKYTRGVSGPRDVLSAICHFAGISSFPGNWSVTVSGTTNVDTASIRIRNMFDEKVINYTYNDAIALRPDLASQFAEVADASPALKSSEADSSIDKKVFPIQSNSTTGISMYGMGSFSVTGLTSPSFVGITTMFSVTGVTYTGTKEISDTGLGWFNDTYISVEKFSSDSGYDEWFLGTGTTITLEDGWFGTGFNQWNYGASYSLGDSENFTDPNWPEGVNPSPSGGSCGSVSENLTSQISVSGTSTFTTAEQYVSGSLHVYYNGQRQVKDVTFTELTSTTFSLTFVANLGDVLNIDYTPLY